MRLVYLIMIFLALSSCDEKPRPEFETNKSLYIGGEVITVKNNSKPFSSCTFQWTMPDGQTLSTKDVSFAINPDSYFDTLNFNLIAKTKGHHKYGLNKSVRVIPRSWFLNYAPSKPRYMNSSSISFDANNLIVTSSVRYSPPLGNGDVYNLRIYFPPNGLPLTGNYILQSSNNNLAPFTSFINLYHTGPDIPVFSDNYVIGNIQVENIYGTIHISFSGIKINVNSTSMSGEIYAPI